MPDGRYVGIKVAHNKPDTFENDEAREKYQKDEMTRLIALKENLENGTTTVDSIANDDLYVLDPTLTDEQIEELKIDKRMCMSR